jgi:benzoyl-CoA-dihydrodiol lyase
VLPGTGGLTRLTDKRHLRRDLADVFATRAEGVQGAEAIAWDVVDEIAAPSGFADAVDTRARALAASSPRTSDGSPVELPPLDRSVADDSIAYRHVHASLDRVGRVIELTVSVTADADWSLTAVRELDDLLCHLRFNEPDLGTILIRTGGAITDAIAHSAMLASGADHAAHETALLWKRTLSRLDLTARSMIAVIEPGSCFAGVLVELALAADRSYMLDGIFEDDVDPAPPATIVLGDINRGPLPMLNGLTRLQSRFWGRPDDLAAAEAAIGRPLDAGACRELGLVTSTPDDLDWYEEVRLTVEERASLSPDALTAMEANHRFAGPETMATKIFARLSAWQNWVFVRPNASGPDGALRRYGSGSRPKLDTRRT